MPVAADTRAWLELTLAAGVGDAAVRALLRAHGDPQTVLDAGARAWRTTVDAATVRALGEGAPRDAVEAALRWCEAADHHLVTLGDPHYPSDFLHLTDAPTLFYAHGRLDALQRPSLAMVGSRHATPQGAATARQFARTLAEAGLVIVSGLALGIDGAAHEGALEAADGLTIAVVGTGIDRVYPARHRELAHRIVERGLILSEFPLGTPPVPPNFPRRNRLISALARGCLVVEAALSSGSLITARYANEQGKEVFAIPGSIHSPVAKGCHALIRDGAKLVDSVEHILEELQWSKGAPREPAHDAEAHPLLDVLGYDPCDVDTLVARSGFDAGTLSATLTRLELEGAVAALPGGRYQRVR